MPRSRISSSYFAGPERRRRRGRDLSLSSIDSHSRTPSPRPGLRHYRPFRDYTDRGRDVEGNHSTRLWGPRYNPHGGAYGWSADNSSEEFYRPTRIPANSFHHERHQGRYDDYSHSGSERSAYGRRHLAQEGYEDDRQLDYEYTSRGQPIRRTDGEAARDFVIEGRRDDMHRRAQRRTARSHYRERSANEADFEDNLSDSSDDYHRRRPSLRETQWVRDWRGIGDDGRRRVMAYGLDELQRDYLDRTRAHERPSSSSDSSDSREQQRRRFR